MIRIGGRGSSSGVSDKGKVYGTEYKSLYQSGNIKFVSPNEGATTAPMETMTHGRVYATVDKAGDVKNITYYDKHNKRYKQIDIKGPGHMVDGKKALPHTHQGYVHDEHGTRLPTAKEQKMIDRILKTWQNRPSK